MLERVLDRGVVIAGDIVVSVVNVELLTLKLRLIIASVETAKEIGLDWWTRDPFLSSRAQGLELEAENRRLRERLDALEARLATGADRLAGDGS
ncbi:MAG TPA: gas vesicle protein [Kofleriaceae bacterium]|nr:gas vesicle protein [Kofleriaceae bacterium]